MLEKPEDGASQKESEVSLERASVDYAGASKKVDPKEIKLVRKIDLIFLVRSLNSPISRSCTHNISSRFSGSLFS